MTLPYKAIDYIITNAPKFAKAKSERVYLEEFRRVKRALLMKQAMEMGYESAVAQEREAYSHPEYLEVLQGLAVAIEQEETLRYMLKAAELRSEVWRTESANERSGVKATE